MPPPPKRPTADVRPLLAQAGAATRAGDHARAASLLEQARTLDPANPELLHALASATRALGNTPEAITLLRRAIARRPKNADWQRELGRMLLAAARFDQALVALKRASDLAPNDPAPHALLASALNRRRRTDEAIAAANRALALDPACADAGMVLARLHIRAGRLDEADAVLAPFAAASAPHHHRATALHLCGDIAEKRAEHDLAFDLHDEGNRAFAELPETRAALRGGRLDRLPDYLSPDAARLYAAWGEARFDDGLPAPIFLVGFPRSGTTLAEQILAAHPDITTTDERNFTEALFQRIAALSPPSDDRPLLPRLDALSDDQIRDLRRDYWTMARREVGADDRRRTIIDKNPLTILDAGLIARLFPEARLIVMLRDPRDTCLSCLFQPFDINPSTARMLDVVSVGEYYARVMGFWLDARDLIANPRLEVRYEHLVGDFESHARRLVEFAGRPWHDDVLRFNEKAAKRAVFSSSFESVARPVTAGAIGRWSRHARRFAPIESTLEPFVARWGADA